MNNKCDILVIAPHPDDAEIHCGATIARAISLGQKVVIADATRGEMGSRGTAETRDEESKKAGEILGITRRENFCLPDGYLSENKKELQNKMVECIRINRPKLVLSMPTHTKHPDHRALGETLLNVIKAIELHNFIPNVPAYRGCKFLCYEAELGTQANILLPCEKKDWEIKKKAIESYGSQLHKKNSKEPITSISNTNFIKWIESRGIVHGHQIQSDYAEAFTSPLSPIAINDITALM